jgi:DNA repair exonuclease SbcCD nuclease subunit
MSDMREPFEEGHKPLAIFTSDWHLSGRVPVARNATSDEWEAVQVGYLTQMSDIQRILKNTPIFHAGDVFHKWNEPAETINWAIRHMPVIHAIPGNHDLPNHNYAELKRSAYWTLVEAGKIVNMRPFMSITHGTDVRIMAYPYGYTEDRSFFDHLKLEQGEKPGKCKFNVALIHAYVWLSGASHPGAREEDHVAAYGKALKGYTHAFFGDNHAAFETTTKNGPFIFNGGAFIRRRSPEINYEPTVTVLWGDGNMRRVRLDTSADRFEDVDRIDPFGLAEMGLDADELLTILADAAEAGISFVETVKRYIVENPNLKPAIRRLLVGAIEHMTEKRK